MFQFDSIQDYVSVWCPLDDVSESNGSLEIPYDTIVHSIPLLPNLNLSSVPGNAFYDKIESYNLSIPPIDTRKNKEFILHMKAGQYFIFSSKLMHRSGVNKSNKSRRIFYAQYSPVIITSSSNFINNKLFISPLSFAIPCLNNINKYNNNINNNPIQLHEESNNVNDINVKNINVNDHISSENRENDVYINSNSSKKIRIL